MFRLMLCIFCLLFFPQNSFGQSWAKKYFEDPSASERMTSIVQTSDGNYVIAGNILNYTNGGDLFYYKITPKGDIIWQIDFPSNGYGIAKGIANRPDEGFVMIGQKGNSGIIFMELLDTGIWTKVLYFKEDKRSLVSGIEILDNGDYLIYGFSDINPDSNIEEYEKFLLRIDSDGAIVYDKTQSMSSIQYFLDIAVSSNNTVYTSSFLPSENITDEPEIIISKWSLESGVFLWEKNLGNGLVTDMIFSEDQQHIIAANTLVNSGFTNQCKILDIDLEGNIVEEYIVQSTSNCETKNILSMDNNQLLLSALEYNANIEALETILFVLDSNKEVVCKNSFETEKQTLPADLLITSENKTVVLANVADIEISKQFPLVISLDLPCDTPDILSEIITPVSYESKIVLSPNPFRDVLNIEVDTPSVSAELFGLYGNYIQNINLYSGPVYLEHLSAGIYFLKFSATAGEYSIRKIIKVE